MKEQKTLNDLKKDIENIHWVDLGINENDKETINKLLKYREFIFNILNRHTNLKEDNPYQKMWEEHKQNIKCICKCYYDMQKFEDKYLGVENNE